MSDIKGEDFSGSHFDIVIAGGSFIGLALARALSLSSDGTLRIAVIDRALPGAEKNRGFDGRASALSTATCEMLEVLGPWHELKAEAQPITHIEITDSSLHATVRPVFLNLSGATADGTQASFMVENRHLLQALTAHVKASENVHFLAPDQVDEFQGTPLRCEIETGSHGRLSASLLVAADGRTSSLRKKAGIKTTGWSYSQVGIVATIAHEHPHEGQAVQHFLPSGPFAILPLTDSRVSLVWTEEEKKAGEILALDEAAFLGEVEKRMGPKYGSISEAGPRGGFPLTMHLARQFIAERFALIGDAAHAVHPIAGQGLNIGFRDIAALTETIIDAQRLGLDIGSQVVLERYQKWRRFDSAFSAFVMDGLNRLFSNDSEPVRALRDLGLGLVERAPKLKDLFIAEAAGLTGKRPKLLKGEKI